jgi:hypothetical protein
MVNTQLVLKNKVQGRVLDTYGLGQGVVEDSRAAQMFIPLIH